MTENGKKEIELFSKAAIDIINAGDAYIKDHDRFVAIYAKMYNVFPNIIDIESDGLYLNIEAKPDVLDVDLAVPLLGGGSVNVVVSDEDANDEDIDDIESKYRFKSIDVNKTLKKIIDTYPDCGYIRNYDWPIIIYNRAVIYWHKYQRELVVLCESDELPQWIVDCVVEKAEEENKRYFDYVTYGSQGFDTIALEVKKQEINLNYNYNDNLPDDAIKNFLNSKESGIAILHGHPGTGKTTYIRHLMYSLKKKEFLVLDSSVFNYITDSSFISLLMEYKNAVIILEDCESMLVDRIAGNGKLSALLNLSDGIIGDAFNFKFLCTFNANIGKIDKALLREGRMKIKYEFKALSADKTQQLAKEIGKDIKEGESLTLAEIYNYGVQNDFTDVDKRTIGFSKK